MHRTFRRAVWALTAAIGIATVYLVVSKGWLFGDDERPAPLDAARQESAKLPPLPERRPPVPVERPPVPVETLSAKVDRLTQSGKNNPADAFAAYEVVATCVLLEGLHKAISGAMPSEDTESLRKARAQRDADRKDCETLSQRQRVDPIRQPDRRREGRRAGAGLAFYREGPAGDQDALQSRPTDPLVVEWKAAAISYVHRDAIRGDINALSAMSDIFSSGRITKPDPKGHLVYRDAMCARVREQQTGRPSEWREIRIAQLSRGMPAQDVAAAKEIAADVVAQCCSSSAVPPSGQQGASK